MQRRVLDFKLASSAPSVTDSSWPTRINTQKGSGREIRGKKLDCCAKNPESKARCEHRSSFSKLSSNFASRGVIFSASPQFGFIPPIWWIWFFRQLAPEVHISHEKANGPIISTESFRLFTFSRVISSMAIVFYHHGPRFNLLCVVAWRQPLRNILFRIDGQMLPVLRKVTSAYRSRTANFLRRPLAARFRHHGDSLPAPRINLLCAVACRQPLRKVLSSERWHPPIDREPPAQIFSDGPSPSDFKHGNSLPAPHVNLLCAVACRQPDNHIPTSWHSGFWQSHSGFWQSHSMAVVSARIEVGCVVWMVPKKACNA